MSHDPLDELRRAWKAVDAPEVAERGGADLASADERTRRTVEWMRAAWLDLDVPEPRIPVALDGGVDGVASPALRPRPIEPSTSTKDWLWLSAAAALVAFWALAALFGTGGGPSPGRSIEPIATKEHSPVAGVGEETSPEATDVVEDGLQLAALDPGRLELRSGPVRLNLLTDSDPGSSREREGDEPR